MPIATWPVDVNQKVNQDGFNEAGERNVAEFKPEVGPPKGRMRTSISSSVITFIGWYSPAEWLALNDVFYKITLADGTQPFTRYHPRRTDNFTATFKFTDVLKITQVKGLVYVVTHSVRVMP